MSALTALTITSRCSPTPILRRHSGGSQASHKWVNPPIRTRIAISDNPWLRSQQLSQPLLWFRTIAYKNTRIIILGKTPYQRIGSTTLTYHNITVLADLLILFETQIHIFIIIIHISINKVKNDRFRSPALPPSPSCPGLDCVTRCHLWWSKCLWWWVIKCYSVGPLPHDLLCPQN